MTFDSGLLLLEGITFAVIVFGALAVFFLRWFSPPREATPLGLWLRYTVLLFGFCLIALIEGILLHPYGLLWFVPVVGITLVVVAKIAPRLLSP
jgi:hypothetical protein